MATCAIGREARTFAKLNTNQHIRPLTNEPAIRDRSVARSGHAIGKIVLLGITTNVCER